MYNKYKRILFTIFAILLIIFPIFFYETFKIHQKVTLINQFQDLDSKRDWILSQVLGAIEADKDWESNNQFYKLYILDAVEHLNNMNNIYARVYDTDYNVLLKNNKSDEMNFSKSGYFLTKIEDDILNDRGCGIYNIVNKTVRNFDENQLNLINYNNDFYYCWSWIPSKHDKPRYLILLMTKPQMLDYTYCIFVFGPIAMIVIYCVLFLGWIYTLYLLRRIDDRTIKKFKK